METIITHSVLFLAGLAWGFGMAAMMKANKRRKRIFPRASSAQPLCRHSANAIRLAGILEKWEATGIPSERK